MYKRKLCAFIICIVLVLAVGGNASGADVKAEEGKTVIEFKGIHEELTVAQSPWPVWRGDAARTGRSKLKGPGAYLRETASVDLFDEKYLVAANRESAFYQLRVGPGNNLIFKYNQLQPYGHKMFSYDMSSGEKWGKGYSTAHSIALDSRGRIYDALSYISHKLRCWNIQRRAEKELQGLNNTILKDIGVSRGEIFSRAREALPCS